jgi:hypothetical protein
MAPRTCAWRLRLGATIAAATVLMAACTSGDADSPAPAPGDVSTTSTSVVDRSGIVLPGVAGATTSTVIERGTTQLTGSVQGPEGLVVGATVRIERLVAGREVRADVLTGPDGRFVLADVPGGRYRVRAFLAPGLAQLQPEALFLEAGEQYDFALTVVPQSGLIAMADVAPKPPTLAGAVNVVVQLSSRVVDLDGVVRATPVVGVQVELSGLGRWVLRDDRPAPSTSTTSGRFDPTTTTTIARQAPSPFAITDPTGRVRFELRCQNPGPSGLYLRVPVREAPPAGSVPGTPGAVVQQSVDLTLPECVDPATATTAPPSSDTVAPVSR